MKLCVKSTSHGVGNEAWTHIRIIGETKAFEYIWINENTQNTQDQTATVIVISRKPNAATSNELFSHSLRAILQV